MSINKYPDYLDNLLKQASDEKVSLSTTVYEQNGFGSLTEYFDSLIDKERVGDFDAVKTMYGKLNGEEQEAFVDYAGEFPEFKTIMKRVISKSAAAFDQEGGKLYPGQKMMNNDKVTQTETDIQKHPGQKVTETKEGGNPEVKTIWPKIESPTDVYDDKDLQKALPKVKKGDSTLAVVYAPQEYEKVFEQALHSGGIIHERPENTKEEDKWKGNPTHTLNFTKAMEEAKKADDHSALIFKAATWDTKDTEAKDKLELRKELQEKENQAKKADAPATIEVAGSDSVHETAAAKEVFKYMPYDFQLEFKDFIRNGKDVPQEMIEQIKAFAIDNVDSLDLAGAFKTIPQGDGGAFFLEAVDPKKLTEIIKREMEANGELKPADTPKPEEVVPPASAAPSEVK